MISVIELNATSILEVKQLFQQLQQIIDERCGGFGIFIGKYLASCVDI